MWGDAPVGGYDTDEDELARAEQQAAANAAALANDDWVHTHTEPHLTQLGSYLLHEHMDEAQALQSGAVSLHDIMKNLPVTQSGELALGGDEQLEEQLNLPPEIRAVQVGDDVVQQYDPTLVDFSHTTL